MSGPAINARVQYCGHDGTFMADIFEVAGANVVRANGPVSGSYLDRPAQGATHKATTTGSGVVGMGHYW